MKNATRKVAVAHFKRWKNQACAVFNSLGREVKVGVLLVAYMLSCPSEGVFAQQPQKKTNSEEKELALDEVVVSTQRSTATFADIARVVSVITKREIEQAGVQSINELLEFVSNVDVRQRGQHGIQADITMRGGTFEQVLILLNGVNVSDPQTGHLNLNLPVSLDAIERVEVIAGSTSRIYGTNAFTGAINLITGSYNDNIAIAKVEAGQYGLWNANLTTTVQKKKSRHLLSLGYKKSDGYIANSDFRMLNAFYQGQFQAKKTKYDVQLGRTSRNFGANTFYTPKYPNQYENTETTFVSAKATFEGKVKFVPTVYYRRGTDRFELFRGYKNKASWYKSHNYHLTNVYGTNLNLSFSSALGKTAVGGDFRSENVLSNKLGDPMTPVRVHGEANAFYNKEKHRNNVSLFFEHTVKFWQERFTATAGIMANYNDSFEGNKMSYFPGIDVSLKLTDRIKIYGTANKALRLPSFTELYYLTPTHQGNKDLVPEEATSFEGGVKYSASGVNAHASYFVRNGKNLIDWTKKGGIEKEKWTARNLTDVDFSGFETALKMHPFVWSEKLDFIKNFNLSYSYTKVGDVKSKFISAYVLDNMKHKFNVEFTLRILPHLFLTTHTSWQDRAGTFSYYPTPTTKDEDAIETEYAPFWLLNSRLTWKSEKYEFFLQGTNLLNEKYYDIGNVIQAGRWISVGAKIKLYW
ncbi:MAG: TonB-dependent receptor [Flavobacteriaceae bacterium]|nr:TonB-dependent receptor [Flavobacteriaceae bacterium]